MLKKENNNYLLFLVQLKLTNLTSYESLPVFSVTYLILILILEVNSDETQMEFVVSKTPHVVKKIQRLSRRNFLLAFQQFSGIFGRLGIRLFRVFGLFLRTSSSLRINQNFQHAMTSIVSGFNKGKILNRSLLIKELKKQSIISTQQTLPDRSIARN